uniref:Uncharacterized protein n=1 Tax=Helianthus annuus TaxID=4232 RepID=A0A251U3J3_HELAN
MFSDHNLQPRIRFKSKIRSKKLKIRSKIKVYFIKIKVISPKFYATAGLKIFVELKSCHGLMLIFQRSGLLLTS